MSSPCTTCWMASIASHTSSPCPSTTSDRTTRETLTLFGRTLCRQDKRDADLPWLLYLQGARASAHRARLQAAAGSSGPCRSFGCCCSISAAPATPVPSTPRPWRDVPREQAHYLGHFRADSIVRDAEYVREVLSREAPGACSARASAVLQPHPPLPVPGQPARGLPHRRRAPIGRSADEVYRATYRRVADKNRAFFTRFPMPRPSPTGWPTTCTTTTCACPTASA